MFPARSPRRNSRSQPPVQERYPSRGRHPAYTVERTANAASVTWEPVSCTPTVNGTHCEVTEPAGEFSISIGCELSNSDREAQRAGPARVACIRGLRGIVGRISLSFSGSMIRKARTASRFKWCAGFARGAEQSGHKRFGLRAGFRQQPRNLQPSAGFPILELRGQPGYRLCIVGICSPPQKRIQQIERKSIFQPELSPLSHARKRIRRREV